MPVEILIDENDTINAIVAADDISVEVIAGLVQRGDTIRLEGLHVELLTGGPLDRRQIRLLCAEVCRYFGTKELIVHGARRTTGRSAGAVPRPIHYKVPN